MAFLPDGMVLLADFKGMIYIADPESEKNNAYELYMEIEDINTKGERGLVSIELDPDFATNSKSEKASISGSGGVWRLPRGTIIHTATFLGRGGKSGKGRSKSLAATT
jgi:glucose/arabinose dehydrogenase